MKIQEVAESTSVCGDVTVSESALLVAEVRAELAAAGNTTLLMFHIYSGLTAEQVNFAEMNSVSLLKENNRQYFLLLVKMSNSAASLAMVMTACGPSTQEAKGLRT